MDAFSNHKAVTLGKEDKSTKGSVDEAILPLVDLINASDDYFTTSSCAGRIVLIEQGKNKGDSRWLFTSHDHVETQDLIASLETITGKPCWLKAESFILHVACRDLDAADRLLRLAHSLGIKRSGITALGGRIIIEMMSQEQLEVPIAFEGEVLFDDTTIGILVCEANAKIRQTREKMEKLRAGFEGVIKE